MAPKLSDRHRSLLEKESGISPRVIAERGYETIEVGEVKRFKQEGFWKHQWIPSGLLIPWNDVLGQKRSPQFRADAPRRDPKTNKFVKYDSVPKSLVCIDVPRSAREWVADPKIDLWITEGVRKADAAVSNGLCCVALIGVWSWKRRNAKRESVVLPDFDHFHLEGRRIILCYDSDVMQNPNVRKALEGLTEELERRGALVYWAILPAVDGAKTGLDDHFGRGGKVEEIKICKPEDVPATTASERKSENPAKKSKSKGGQSGEIEELAFANGLELWRDSSGEPYASFRKHGRLENVRCPSKELRGYLFLLFKKATGNAPSAQVLKEVEERLELLAIYDGAERATALRIWSSGDIAYVDLADAERRIVKIDFLGWQILEHDAEIPVRFLRTSTMMPLPVPTQGGSLNSLRKVLSITDESFAIVTAWWLGNFLPRGAMPILLASGEQGSGKSSGCRYIRALIDPNRSPLRTLPKEPRSLAAAVRSSWVLAFDNVSGLRAEMSDLFCSVSTGLGINQYRLYTDADEINVPARAPVILNGIGDIANRPDFLDRTLPVFFVRIEGTGKRLSEADLDDAFHALHPEALGALLTLVSRAFEQLPELDSDLDLPRLADLGRFVTASESGAERGTFLRLLASARSNQGADVVEGDVLGAALEEYVRAEQFIQAPAAKILESLNTRLEVKSRPRDWPSSPRALTSRMQRLAPALRKVGITIDQGVRTGDRRSWILQVMTRETVDKSIESEAREINTQVLAQPPLTEVEKNVQLASTLSDISSTQEWEILD